MARVMVIAELGSSPAPDWDFGLWCAVAANCGATGVKVQLWLPEHFGADEAKRKRPYMFPRGRLISFVRIAHAYHLTAGASVFDADAVTLAALHCDWLKLAARESQNVELREQAHNTGKLVYRSLEGFETRPHTNEVTLYAIQHYPAPMLLSMWRVMQAKWHYWDKHPWGYSSHTRGYYDCVLAASLGAVVIEKHLALQPTDIEAGHSLLPGPFAQMVRAIRKVE